MFQEPLRDCGRHAPLGQQGSEGLSQVVELDFGNPRLPFQSLGLNLSPKSLSCPSGSVLTWLDSSIMTPSGIGRSAMAFPALRFWVVIVFRSKWMSPIRMAWMSPRRRPVVTASSTRSRNVG